MWLVQDEAEEGLRIVAREDLEGSRRDRPARAKGRPSHRPM